MYGELPGPDESLKSIKARGKKQAWKYQKAMQFREGVS